MKKHFKKTLALLMMLAISIGAILTVSAAYDREYTYANLNRYIYTGNNTSFVNDRVFSDISHDHWAKIPAIVLAEQGVFMGMGDDGTGNPLFYPEKQVTRAEAVTAIVRVMYPEEAAKVVPGEKWWSGYYDIAFKNRLLREGEYDNGDLDKIISREEISLIAWRASIAFRVEPIRDFEPGNEIPDFYKGTNDYLTAIFACVSSGIMKGVDEKGNFNPYGKVTRAELATIIYRIKCPENKFCTDGHDFAYLCQDVSVEKDGYTFYYCKTCGYGYTEFFAKRYTKLASGFVNTGGRPLNKDCNRAEIPGQMVIADEDAPVFDPYARNAHDPESPLGSYFYDYYDLYFDVCGLDIPGGSSYGHIYKTERHRGNHENDDMIGMRVFEWANGKNRNGEYLNCALEGMRFLSGDPELAYALFCWFDDFCCEIDENRSEDYGYFGIELVSKNEEGEPTMLSINGQLIELEYSKRDIYERDCVTLWFHKTLKA